ncbi:DEAD/DEAH box helicase [Roseateles sp. SL47]|uniref:DEAD/DEAH box helicase n=1 Tax=Roseateles sp. SL47 TaxID=2995138 RepID=UPI0022704C6E|nr:DEAD/DEAH box helicase [Roseateles sp. SL47]
MAFATLGLHEALQRAVKDSGYEHATEVQARAIPPALGGADLMVSSRTGSGKTASFILPALQQVLDTRTARASGPKVKVQGPRVLVLAPTRELAMQVAKSAMTYGRHIQGLRVATVLGGMPYAQQLRMLSGPLDILIATPGRLLDHINSGRCKLDNVSMFVLDEADRMLDMGFIEDIEFVAQQLPVARQTLMYSATFAGHTGRLAEQLMKDPQRIDVSGHTETHENIEQRLHWADNGQHKRKLLEHILAERDVDQAVVFTSTQQDTEWLAEALAEIGHRVAALHGGMPQGKRNRTLMMLRRRDLRVLVATDVAARGIDVPTISHVINFGLPMKAEDYVHRIGRTGRAGRSGIAVTLAERQDLSMIKRIQQFTTQQIPVSRIVGLEPRNEEPRIFPTRDRNARGGDHRGNFRGGDRGGFGGPGRGFGHGGPARFDNRGEGRPDARFDRPEGRFDNRPPRSEPRGEQGARFEGRPPRFEPRADQRPEGGRFEPRGDRRPDAPRFGDQRPPFQRDAQGRGGDRRDGGGFQGRPQRPGEPRAFEPRGDRQERPAFRGGDNRFDDRARFEGRPEGGPRFGGKPGAPARTGGRPGDERQDRGGFQARRGGPRKGF